MQQPNPLFFSNRQTPSFQPSSLLLPVSAPTPAMSIDVQMSASAQPDNSRALVSLAEKLLSGGGDASGAVDYITAIAMKLSQQVDASKIPPPPSPTNTSLCRLLGSLTSPGSVPTVSTVGSSQLKSILNNSSTPVSVRPETLATNGQLLQLLRNQVTTTTHEPNITTTVSSNPAVAPQTSTAQFFSLGNAPPIGVPLPGIPTIATGNPNDLYFILQSALLRQSVSVKLVWLIKLSYLCTPYNQKFRKEASCLKSSMFPEGNRWQLWPKFTTNLLTKHVPTRGLHIEIAVTRPNSLTSW